MILMNIKAIIFFCELMNMNKILFRSKTTNILDCITEVKILEIAIIFHV